MNQYGLSMTGSAVRPASPKSVVRFSSHSNYIQHYGVPGQKWGVITKEYEPVAVDHRRMRKPETYSIRRKANPKTAYNSSRTANGLKTREDYRREAQAIRERNEKVRKKVIIGSAVVLGLIAAYGTYRYARVQKAKAYAGLLNRFLKQNPGASLSSESGRRLLQGGAVKAYANSRTLADAKSTNQYLKQIGKTVNKKDALRLYRARNSISRLSNVSVSPTGSRTLEAMKKMDRRRLTRLLLSKYRI